MGSGSVSKWKVESGSIQVPKWNLDPDPCQNGLDPNNNNGSRSGKILDPRGLWADETTIDNSFCRFFSGQQCPAYPLNHAWPPHSWKSPRDASIDKCRPGGSSKGLPGCWGRGSGCPHLAGRGPHGGGGRQARLEHLIFFYLSAFHISSGTHFQCQVLINISFSITKDNIPTCLPRSILEIGCVLVSFFSQPILYVTII